MNELIFNGMDIPDQVVEYLKKVENAICCEMNEPEKTAFKLGVGNTLAILRTLLEMDEEPVVHIPGLNGMEEMDIAELEERFLD